MGILDGLLGEQIGSAMGLPQNLGGLDYQFLAAQKLGHGLEPIDWPQIIVNQCRAIAFTIPLSRVEQFTYDGALQALNGEKDNV